MSQPTQTLHQRLKQHEKEIIIAELKRGRMMYQTAEALGIRYCTLWRKMRQHGITGA
jgi:transcriptional regulator of acetoin/glycerol metabolism|tara:strand:+ start:54 stop:224 length:171 start_codon:yes stop_codon:yes gene_type:complete